MPCSRCKVSVYCNKVCQSAHWSSSHKKTCKALMLPPGENETVLPPKADDDPDLEVPYKYVVIRPQEEQSREGLFRTTSGVTESACLDQLVGCGVIEDLSAEVQEDLSITFGLGPAIVTCIVPGYSYDFDGQRQVLAFYNQSGTSAVSAKDNAIGSAVLMKVPSEVRGPVVLAVLRRVQPTLLQAEGATVAASSSSSSSGSGSSADSRATAPVAIEPTEDSASARQEPLLFCRRQVVDLAMHNSACGGAGCVSRRVHFENMRRKEVLMNFKQQGYQLFDGAAIQ